MNTRVFVLVIRITSQLVWLMAASNYSSNLKNTEFRKIPTNGTSSRVCRSAIITTVASSKLSCLKRCHTTCSAVTFKKDSGACSLCNLQGLVSVSTFEDLQVYRKEYSKEFIASNFTATWQFARDHCNQYFNGLAIVLDQQENDRMLAAITVGSHPTNYHWIGASKVGISWYWSTNEGDLVDVIWFYWEPGQPNAMGQTCLLVWNGYAWFDYVCSNNLYFVCQRYTYQ